MGMITTSQGTNHLAFFHDAVLTFAPIQVKLIPVFFSLKPKDSHDEEAYNLYALAWKELSLKSKLLNPLLSLLTRLHSTIQLETGRKAGSAL